MSIPVGHSQSGVTIIAYCTKDGKPYANVAIIIFPPWLHWGEGWLGYTNDSGIFAITIPVESTENWTSDWYIHAIESNQKVEEVSGYLVGYRWEQVYHKWINIGETASFSYDFTRNGFTGSITISVTDQYGNPLKAWIGASTSYPFWKDNWQYDFEWRFVYCDYASTATFNNLFSNTSWVAWAEYKTISQQTPESISLPATVNFAFNVTSPPPPTPTNILENILEFISSPTGSIVTIIASVVFAVAIIFIALRRRKK
jgi:hypothetical protein